MITQWIAWIVTGAVTCLVLSMLNAPLGYEDEDGFHFGTQDETEG